MFSAGLSTTLIEALSELCKYIPQLLATVQDRLLKTIAQLLAHTNRISESMAAAGPKSRSASVSVAGMRPARFGPMGSVSGAGAKGADNKGGLDPAQRDMMTLAL